MTTDNEDSQRELVDRLVRTAIKSTDMWVIDHRDELDQLTAAQRTRLIVHAAIAALVAEDLISEPDHRSEWVRVGLPVHLEPDLAAETQAAQRLRGALS